MRNQVMKKNRYVKFFHKIYFLDGLMDPRLRTRNPARVLVLRNQERRVDARAEETGTLCECRFLGTRDAVCIPFLRSHGRGAHFRS
jgi:hypothetical protein